MQELIDHIKRCSARAAAARPGDLAALVALHVDLLATPDLVTSSKAIPADQLPRVFTCIDRVANLVESVVLSETETADISVAEVSRQISELQKMVCDVTGMPVSNRVEKPVAPHAPVKIAEERVITETDAAMAIEFVGEANTHLEMGEASLLRLEDDPGDMNEVNAVFRSFHTIKGVAGFLELKQIGALAHAAETLLDLARKGKIQLIGAVLDVVLEARDVMGKLVQGVETAARTQAAPVVQNGLDNLLVRLDAATRGETAEPNANAGVANPAVESGIETAGIAPEQEATAPAAEAAPSASHAAPVGEAVVKVSTGRLDALINAIGELVISQAMVAQDLGTAALVGNQRLGRNLSHLGKITRGLQELSMSMRMVPISGVFQKMARLSRDVSRKAGKEIEFVQIGGETELDRNVVEAISDPLVHMVRNSIDHGVEKPEDREKAGKPRAGRVVLKACHQSGNVVVQITDDGRGLNTQRIVQKAIAAGIVKEGQELTEQQIFQLIFHPGLSTAEKITDISGRGVGMDVVRKNVEALRGRIEITSVAGKGSTFTVRLPLTLAVIDGLIVRVGAQRYIIPITSIEQSIRPTAAQLSSVHGRGELCMVRDRLLPIIRLHQLFKVEPKNTDPTHALVVIVQDGPDLCCLLVDELVGQQQVVIKSVGKEIGELPGIAGCAILGDGNVSLILDIGGIIHSALK